MPLVAPRGQVHGWRGLEPLQVARGELASLAVEMLEPPELPESDTGRDVGQVVLASCLDDVCIPVVGALYAVKAQALDQSYLGGMTDAERPAFDRGQVLVRVEAEGDEIAKAADPAPAVAGTDRVGGVLNHSQLAPLRQGVEGVHIYRQPCKMHRHDGAG